MRRASKSRRPERSLGEAEFLARYDITKFERPSVAVDVVALTAVRGAVKVVVYRRTAHPAKGQHALPGGFVRIDESLDGAAARLLRDKSGLEDVFVEQLYTFGAPERDPRGRIITVGYYALVDPHRIERAVAKVEGALLATVRVPWTG